MKNALVAYFSATGTTAKAAQTLADALGTELYRITPAIPYTKADLDWTDKNSRSSREIQDRTAHPALADNEADFSPYQVIFLGFPIWWYVAPAIIHTFLEQYDFSGKTIVPFATSGGSGLRQAVAELRAALPAEVRLLPGRLLNGRLSVPALQDWADTLGL